MYSTCTRIWPKNRTFAVASVQVAVGWVLIRRFRIFSGQCIRIYSVRVYDIAQCSPVVLAQWTHDMYLLFYFWCKSHNVCQKSTHFQSYISILWPPPPLPPSTTPLAPTQSQTMGIEQCEHISYIVYCVHCVQDTNILPAYGTQSTTNIAITIGPFEELL